MSSVSAASPGAAKQLVFGKPLGLDAKDHSAFKRYIQAGHARLLIFKCLFLNRGGKAGDRGDILGAGATAQFLAAAMNQRFERQAIAHDESADAQ